MNNRSLTKSGESKPASVFICAACVINPGIQVTFPDFNAVVAHWQEHHFKRWDYYFGESNEYSVRKEPCLR